MKKNIVQYLEDTVKLNPYKIAYYFNQQKINFFDLRKKAISIAYFLLKKGFNRKKIVIFTSDVLDTLVLYFASMYSNNIYIPVDISMGVYRISKILENINVDLIIYDNKENVDILMENIVSDILILSYNEILEKLFCNFSICEKEILENLNIQKDYDIAYITFTSGSTGIPKGVVTNHRSVINYIDALGEALNFDENTIFGNQAPLYMDASLKDIISTVKYGCTTHILDRKLFILPNKLLDYLNINKINTLCWVPSAFEIIFRTNALKNINLPFLKKIAFSGEKISSNKLKYLFDNLDVEIYNLYGTTETTGVSTYYKYDRNNIVNNCIGKSLKNNEILLISKNKLSTEGFIYIKTDSLSFGYYGNIKETETVFVQNPLHNDYVDKVYFTGDIAKYDENGNLILIGRLDNQIKQRGYRLNLEEIENIILEKLKVEVVAIYDDILDEIILFYDNDIDDILIKNFCSNNFAKFIKIKQLYRIDKIPRTDNGKIDRLKLKLKFNNKEII